MHFVRLSTGARNATAQKQTEGKIIPGCIHACTLPARLGAIVTEEIDTALRQAGDFR